MKRALLIAAFIAALVWLCVFIVTPRQGGGRSDTLSTRSASSTHEIEVAGVPVYVTDVTTHEDQERGLGGRSGLESNEGMLFIFPRSDRFAFWMKDMHFSIDIVWISESGEVVFIAPSVSPETYPAHFVNEEPARYVLELPAGWMKLHGVKKGDKVRL